MLKRRLIPVLFLKDGWMVRSQTFSMHQYIGDPVHHVRRMMQWEVDELMVLDIGIEEQSFAHERKDYRHKPVETVLDFINLISVECHIPLTFGGRIRSVDDVAIRILNGADKVAVNTLLASDPGTVKQAALAFGSQAIVASIDYRGQGDAASVFTAQGKEPVSAHPVDWAKRAVDFGVGEILLNSIDRDGTAMGYDLETITAVTNAVPVPVIACGGAGMEIHFSKCYDQTPASAVAAGNIYHFKENAYPNAKKYLRGLRNDIR